MGSTIKKSFATSASFQAFSSITPSMRIGEDALCIFNRNALFFFCAMVSICMRKKMNTASKDFTISVCFDYAMQRKPIYGYKKM
jgi:hypothetical protein